MFLVGWGQYLTLLHSNQLFCFLSLKDESFIAKNLHQMRFREAFERVIEGFSDTICSLMSYFFEWKFIWNDVLILMILLTNSKIYFIIHI